VPGRPDQEQQAALNRTFGCARVVWNQPLAVRHERYRTDGQAYLVRGAGPGADRTGRWRPGLRRHCQARSPGAKLVAGCWLLRPAGGGAAAGSSTLG